MKFNIYLLKIKKNFGEIFENYLNSFISTGGLSIHMLSAKNVYIFDQK